MHQLPLVLFTVCLQAATGLLLFMGALTLGISGARGDAAARGALRKPLPFMWGLFAFALGASVLHLGRPLNALHVVRGVANGSPMSVEILCIGVFGALTLLYTLLLRTEGRATLRKALLVLAMAAGLALSYAVANVYAIATIPLWNSPWTFVQFFMSVLALGCIGMAAALHCSPNLWSERTRRRWHTLSLIILLALAATTALYAAWTGGMLGRDGETAASGLPLLRVLLQGTGVFLLALAGRKDGGASRLYLCVFLCVLGSELAGRIFFYNLQQASGMLQVLMY